MVTHGIVIHMPQQPPPNRIRSRQVPVRMFQSQADYLKDMAESEERTLQTILMRALKAQYPVLEQIEQAEMQALKGAK